MKAKVIFNSQNFSMSQSASENENKIKKALAKPLQRLKSDKQEKKFKSNLTLAEDADLMHAFTQNNKLRALNEQLANQLTDLLQKNTKLTKSFEDYKKKCEKEFNTLRVEISQSQNYLADMYNKGLHKQDKNKKRIDELKSENDALRQRFITRELEHETQIKIIGAALQNVQKNYSYIQLQNKQVTRETNNYREKLQYALDLINELNKKVILNEIPKVSAAVDEVIEYLPSFKEDITIQCINEQKSNNVSINNAPKVVPKELPKSLFPEIVEEDENEQEEEDINLRNQNAMKNFTLNGQKLKIPGCKSCKIQKSVSSQSLIKKSCSNENIAKSNETTEEKSSNKIYDVPNSDSPKSVTPSNIIDEFSPQASMVQRNIGLNRLYPLKDLFDDYDLKGPEVTADQDGNFKVDNVILSDIFFRPKTCDNELMLFSGTNSLGDLLQFN